MTEPSIQKIPHGIAEREQGRLYVVGTSGELHCLALANGALIARTTFPAQPLTAQQDQLFVWQPLLEQVETIQLAALTIDNAAFYQYWVQQLPLDRASLHIDQENLRYENVGQEVESFQIRGSINQNELLVTWEAHLRNQGGAPPSVYDNEDAHLDVCHYARLDAQTGEILANEQQALPQIASTLPHVAPPKRIVPYRQNAEWKSEPWSFGTQTAYLTTTATGTGIILVHKADEQAIFHEDMLTETSDAIVLVTPDGGYLFLSQPDEAMWSIFSTKTGEQLIQLPLAHETIEVAIVDTFVLSLAVVGDIVREETLYCHNLATAQPIWSYPLEIVARRGAPPLRP